VHRRLLRIAPLLAVALAGCFIDFGGAPALTTASTGPGTSTSAADTTTGEQGTSAASTTSTGTSTTALGVTSTADATTTDASTGPADASTTTTGATTELTSSGGVEPFCGDGLVDPGEACDDGNQLDDDLCRADCSLPTCDDAVKNQDESDVDCGGGVCPTCGHCQACRGNVDCVAGSFCTKGKCVASAMVQISLLKHCGPAMANWTVGPPLPPGNYRITAEAGGGRVAKASGFGWRAACDGLDFGAMFVPFKEPSADAAFAALPVTQVDSPYPGGVLRCGIIDTICSDNLGGADFSVHLLCE